MGIGMAEDLLVILALGVDMVRRVSSSRSALSLHYVPHLTPFLLSVQADCVFPTRTARFGQAITFDGFLDTRSSPRSYSFPPPRRSLTSPQSLSFPARSAGARSMATDLSTIEEGCPCPTCTAGTTRAFLHSISGTPNAASGACHFSTPMSVSSCPESVLICRINLLAHE